MISWRFVLLVSSERSLLAEESSQCRVNAHNFTLRRPLGIGLLDRISRRKEEERRAWQSVSSATAAKKAEWMFLGRGRSSPGGPRRSLREAWKDVEIALPYLVNAFPDYAKLSWRFLFRNRRRFPGNVRQPFLPLSRHSLHQKFFFLLNHTICKIHIVL